MKNNRYTILITGIAGLIGSNFAKYVIDHYPQIRIIGLDCMEEWGNDLENIPWEGIYKNGGVVFKKNLAHDTLDDVFNNNNIDIVYHFASYAAEGLSPYMRIFTYENNNIATANLLNNCIKYDVGKIVYTSSMSVYGDGIDRYFDEDDILNPKDPYAISKMCCEIDIKNTCEHSNLKYVIIRPHNVFGIGQNINDKYRNVLGIWMHQILEESPMTIYGSGEQTRMFTYVDNILPSLFKVGISDDYNDQIFNLGGLDEISINEAAKTLSIITGYNNIVHLEGRGQGEVKFTHPLPDKSIQLLDYSDKVSFIEGLEKMWKWVKEKGIKEWFEWDNFELDKDMPTYFKIRRK